MLTYLLVVALGFLSQTLELLNRDTLRQDQGEFAATCFGSWLLKNNSDLT